MTAHKKPQPRRGGPDHTATARSAARYARAAKVIQKTPLDAEHADAFAVVQAAIGGTEAATVRHCIAATAARLRGG
jgi:hypothetical protein